MLELHVGVDRPGVREGTSSRVNLLVEIVAAASATESARPPLTVFFVLDVSGSMNGPPLEQVLRSTERMIQLLGPKDRAGVIAFSNDAEGVAQRRVHEPAREQHERQRSHLERRDLGRQRDW